MSILYELHILATSMIDDILAGFKKKTLIANASNFSTLDDHQVM
jgi:hypothetical protein